MAVRGKRSGRDLGLALAALLGALVVLDRGAMVAECRNRHRKAAAGVGLERGDTHKAGDLIGWRGEVHKVETAKPDPGQPFVMSEYWDISYINLSKKGIESLGPSVITLANYEGLVGHAQSVIKRIRRK